MVATNIVIIPYYSEEEVSRYGRISEHLLGLGPQANRFEFLLASSPRIEPSRRLLDQFSRIAPVRTLACPTQVFGYPQGPTAMFWDCMDHIAATTENDGGFSLWMESDMVPVKSNWLDRLAGEWRQGNDLMALGRLVPALHRRRLFRRTKQLTPEHINGGACYAKNFSRLAPQVCRDGVFDIAIYPFLKRSGRFLATEAIAFSTVNRCRQDVLDPRRVILHGFLQDKDAFIDRCLQRDDFGPSATLPSVESSWNLTRIWFDAEESRKHRRERFLKSLLRTQET